MGPRSRQLGGGELSEPGAGAVAETIGRCWGIAASLGCRWRWRSILRARLLQSDTANGGKAVVQRKAINDTRGHVSELLSKCMANGALDSELTKEDRERMTAFLKVYGPLNEKSAYVGSERAGYKIAPGAGTQVGVDDPPMDMRVLLDEDFWGALFIEEAWDWQATMMQPVGGMDRIPYAFAGRWGRSCSTARR